MINVRHLKAWPTLAPIRRAYRSTRELALGFGELAAHKWFQLSEGPRIRRLRGRHLGQRCFLIGNGPSIRQQDLSVLKDEVTFATNWFLLHDQFPQLDVDYYCVSDPQMWSTGEIHPLLSEAIESGNCTFFLEQSARAVAPNQGVEAHARLFYLWLKRQSVVQKGLFNLDIAQHVSWGSTVMIDFCIPIAHYMGFKTIYLLGCDCDYRLHEASDGSSSHFYSESNLGRSIDAVTTIAPRMLEVHRTEWTDRLIAGYQVVKRTMDGSGCRIYNAGVGGRLDVFERVSLDQVLSEHFTTPRGQMD